MKKAFNIYVRVFSFLVPIFFLPILNNSFGLAKNSLLLLSGMIGLLLWVLSRIVEKRDSIKVNGVFGLVILGLIWSTISYLRLSVGARAMSLVYPVGFGSVLGIFAWLFLWIQAGSKEEREKQFVWMSVAGIVVALSSLVTFLIPESKLPLLIPKENPLISISQGWSLTGSLIAEIVFLSFLVISWVKKLMEKIKEGDYVINAVVSGVFVLALGVSIYKVVDLGWSILDYTSSWVIAAETFKRSAIFGVGLGNYSQAFSLFRPESFNLTPYWAASFRGAGMAILQIWTETGIVGLGIVSLIVMKLLKKSRGFDLIKNALLVVLVLAMPMSLVSVFVFAWVLVGAFERKKLGLVLRVGDAGYNVAPAMLGVLILASLGWSGVVYGKILRGDMYLRTSFVKAAVNDGVGAYNNQISAVGMNPNMAEYRVIYSQTNLALALNILENEDISDEDKERASTLIQQSVREAKAAISLDSLNAAYWSNLAVIYRNIIGIVEGADEWSAQAYQQAIALDPTNSGLRLEFGSLLYAAENYEAAERVFEEAVRVKQNFPNAWYNWAYAAKKQNKLGEAVQRLEQAVALVPKDSGDYEKANEELSTWKKELDEAIKKQEAAIKEEQSQAKEAETLKTAEPLPTVSAEEKVDVPEGELEPPASPENNPEVSPSPESEQ